MFCFTLIRGEEDGEKLKRKSRYPLVLLLDQSTTCRSPPPHVFLITARPHRVIGVLPKSRNSYSSLTPRRTPHSVKQADSRKHHTRSTPISRPCELPATSPSRRLPALRASNGTKRLRIASPRPYWEASQAYVHLIVHGEKCLLTASHQRLCGLRYLHSPITSSIMKSSSRSASACRAPPV